MIIAVLVAGLVLGSFVNAAVWRIYTQSKTKTKKAKAEYSIMSGRSMCPHCKHQLAPLDLVPVLSWVVLRGKCRYCAKPISAQYPVVELITSVLFVAVFLKLQPDLAAMPGVWLQVILWFYIVTVFMILSIYDLRWMLLPDVVMLPAIVVALVAAVASLMLGQPSAELYGKLMAAAGAGAFFYTLAVITRGKGMGGGDIKLVVLIGLVLGVEKTLLALFIAFCSGALIGVGLISLAQIKKAKRPKYIPFGPFLMGGTMASFIWGSTVIAWYLEKLYL